MNRPAEERGFRLERQDKADRQMRYTLHPYAQQGSLASRPPNLGGTSRENSSHGVREGLGQVST